LISLRETTKEKALVSDKAIKYSSLNI